MVYRSTCSSSKKSSYFLFSEDFKNFSALLEEPGSIPQDIGAKSKKKENLAIQLKIAEMQMKLTKLNASPQAPGAFATTPSFSPVKLQFIIAPKASSLPSLPSEFWAIPSLDQLRARKKYRASMPNDFLFSPIVQCNMISYNWESLCVDF